MLPEVAERSWLYGLILGGLTWLALNQFVEYGAGPLAPLKEVINLFLGKFSEELPAGVHAVLIWDGAGYHTSGDLVVPANVSLIQLPPYSPELNPVENLWHYLRSHYWSLRVYRDYEALEEAA